MELRESPYCQEIFALGIAKVERVGTDHVRLWLYTEEHNEAGQVEKVIVCKLMRPVKTLVVSDKLLAMADPGPGGRLM